MRQCGIDDNNCCFDSIWNITANAGLNYYVLNVNIIFGYNVSAIDNI